MKLNVTMREYQNIPEEKKTQEIEYDISLQIRYVYITFPSIKANSVVPETPK